MIIEHSYELANDYSMDSFIPDFFIDIVWLVIYFVIGTVLSGVANLILISPFTTNAQVEFLKSENTD